MATSCFERQVRCFKSDYLPNEFKILCVICVVRDFFNLFWDDRVRRRVFAAPCFRFDGCFGRFTGDKWRWYLHNEMCQFPNSRIKQVIMRIIGEYHKLSRHESQAYELHLPDSEFLSVLSSHCEVGN